MQWAPSESEEESAEDNDVYETIQSSRELRSQPDLLATTRTVGNDIICNRLHGTHRPVAHRYKKRRITFIMKNKHMWKLKL